MNRVVAGAGRRGRRGRAARQRARGVACRPRRARRGWSRRARCCLYEQDTGTVVFARDAQRGAADREHDEDDDGARHARSTSPRARSSPSALRRRAPGESLAPVPAGARLSLADMLRAMLLPSGNNVAYSLAIDVAGSVAALRRDDERRGGARCGLGRHALHDADRPRHPARQPLDGARPRAARRRAAARPAARADRRRAAARASPTAIVVENLNDLLGALPVGRRRQDRPHRRRRLVPGRRREPRRRAPDQRRARRAERRRARRRHARAAALRAAPLPSACRSRAAGRSSRRVAGRRARRARCGSSRAARWRSCSRARRRCTPRASASRRGCVGPLPAGDASRARSACARTAASSPSVPLVTADAPCSRRGRTQHAGAWLRRRRRCGLTAVAAVGVACRSMRRRSARGALGTPAMIITVTLNAAIDKSLSVPSFRLGRRHRTVERRALAGGKGVNIARMLKTLGEPVIATGFAGRADRHADRRAARRGVDPPRLRAHPRGVAHQHLGRSTRRPASRPRSTSRARRSTPDEVEQFREKLLYLARGAAIVVLAGSLPRGIEPDFYAQLVRELRKLDVTTDRRLRRRGAAARRARRARRRLAERRRGRGARRPRVQRRRRPRRRGARDRLARRALGDHDAARGLLGAGARRRRAAASTA